MPNPRLATCGVIMVWVGVFGEGKESEGVWLREGEWYWVGQSLIGGNCRRGLVMVTTH